jgi:hypothetical protein
MTTNIDSSIQIWPFLVDKEDSQKPEVAEKIEFLKDTHAKGFEAYWLPKAYEYGSSSPSRSGCIVQLTHKSIWELRLHENSNQRLTAFIKDFQMAGIAIVAWLDGHSVEEIFKDIDKYLIAPPELGYSHKIYEADTHFYRQYWPFPITELENQSSGEMEKIDFLQNVCSDGFAAYRTVGIWDEYGVESKSRSGFVIRRGLKNRWEFELFAKDAGPQLTAFVTSFEVSGTALRDWLNGRSVSEILEDINKYLAVLPGAKRSSYTLYEVELNN